MYLADHIAREIKDRPVIRCDGGVAVLLDLLILWIFPLFTLWACSSSSSLLFLAPGLLSLLLLGLVLLSRLVLAFGKD